MPESWTVLRLLTWTTDFLKSHGAESPRLDAEVLLAHARGCERIMLYTAFDEVVSDEVRARFRDLVKQRSTGAPVAYLVGKREFFSLSFRVTPAVLIPRPETEFLVVAALDALKSSRFQVPGSESETSHSPLVADVGTGSGAIAVAIAKHAPSAQIIATDISPVALAIAQENAATHGLADRIEFLEADLLTKTPPKPRFAVIASNPPYIGEGELPSLSPSVRDHEPRQALIAGPTGTEIIERLVPQAAQRLLPGGYLILEISPMIVERVTQLLLADGHFEQPSITKDLSGLPRIVQARLAVR